MDEPKMNNRYALALILPHEVGTLLDELRGQFRSQMTYINMPHITLGYFMTNLELPDIKETFARLAETNASFTLQLDKIDYFEGKFNTAYVAIDNHQPVIGLRASIINRLQGLDGTSFEDMANSETYHPHVTIGTNIPESSFSTIREYLSKLKVHLVVQAETLALASFGEGGKFRIESLFKLSG